MSVVRLVRSLGTLSLAAVLALPLWSVLARSDVPLGLKLVVTFLWGTTALRPVLGVQAFVVTLPLALGVYALFPGLSPTAVSECLVLSFASAAVLRFTWSQPGRPEWLASPAIVLGAAVVTSAVDDLMGVRAVAPGRPFLADLWQHVTVSYWTDQATNWSTLHDAIRWVAVLATAVGLERAARASADLARRLTWMWVGAAAAATTFTVVRVAEVVSRAEVSAWRALVVLLSTERLSVLHPDQNAAGSLFGLLLVAACAIGLARRQWWMVAVPAPLLLFGFVFAQSRAAIGAVALVLAAWWIATRWGHRRQLVQAVVATAVALALVGTWMVTSRSHIAAGQALSLRVELATVGLRMAARYPVWGVGLGDYARTSRRFLPADFAAASGFGRGGENAHNNLLQVIVELGVPAGAVFVWLVVPVAAFLWRGRQTTMSPEYVGLALGVTVFLLSALFGHPLLIPEVAGMFFVALGLAAGQCAGPIDARHRARRLAAAGVAFYAASLAWRLWS